MESFARSASLGVRAWWNESTWTAFLVRRLARLVLSVFLVVTGTFAMMHMIPGDPVRAALGGLKADPGLVEARRHQLGLDRPLVEQYLRYIGGIVTGDLGSSIITGQPVSGIVADRLPSTLKLVTVAFAVTVLISYPLGLVMAVLTQNGRRRRLELVFTSITGVIQCVPEFVLAAGLIALFAVSLKILPVAYEPGLLAYVLPVLSLVLGSVAVLSRIIRVEGLKVLTEDFIRTARSKRLPPRVIYVRHALPNMLTASLTLSGLFLSGLVAGTVLVESVFGWPGVSRTLVQAVVAGDYPVAQALSLLLGTIVLVVNLLVDMMLAAIDPRSTLRET